MNRLQAGLVAGIGGAIIIAISGFVNALSFCGPFPALIGGIVAGTLVARNPAFSQRTVAAATLAGLTAGVVMFIGQIIAGIILNGQPGTNDTITTLIGTMPTPEPGSSTTTITAATYHQIFLFMQTCIGLIDVTIATIAGAITGAIARPRIIIAPTTESPNSPPTATNYGDYPPIPQR
jgi:hypothetical protein